MTMSQQKLCHKHYGQHVGGYDDLRAKDAVGTIDGTV